MNYETKSFTFSNIKMIGQDLYWNALVFFNILYGLVDTHLFISYVMPTTDQRISWKSRLVTGWVYLGLLTGTIGKSKATASLKSLCKVKWQQVRECGVSGTRCWRLHWRDFLSFARVSFSLVIVHYLQNLKSSSPRVFYTSHEHPASFKFKELAVGCYFLLLYRNNYLKEEEKVTQR